MPRRLRAAAVVLAAVGVLLCAQTAHPVDAQWLDREVASATFQAKTVPAPRTAGTPPYCSWNSFITTTALVFTWAPPAGYPATSIQITAQKGAATQVVTGATTTSSAGVYTTTVPVSLLGGTIIIHLAVEGRSSSTLP